MFTRRKRLLKALLLFTCLTISGTSFGMPDCRKPTFQNETSKFGFGSTSPAGHRFSRAYLNYMRSLRRDDDLRDPYLYLPPISTAFHQFDPKRAVNAETFISVGSGGEGYFALKKNGETWRSSQGPNPFAVESDPTWVISALGPKVAAYLGFRLVDTGTMYVPNAKLFNRRIEALNSRLRQKGYEEISARWVDSIPPGKISEGEEYTYSESYVRQNSLHNTSPFSPDEIIHDTAHHALEILIDQEHDRPGKLRAIIGVQFADFIRQHVRTHSEKFPLLSNPKNREAFLAFMFQMMSRSRDNFSGLIPVVLLDARNSLDLGYSKYFKIVRMDIGDAFDTLFAFRPMSIQGYYTLNGWLTVFIKNHVLKALDLNYEGDRAGDFGGINLLYKYTNKKFEGRLEELDKNHAQLTTEVTAAMTSFIDAHQNELDVVLAQYDSSQNVLSGIAPREHIVNSLERRVREFKEALE